MQLKYAPHEYSKIFHWNDIATSIYLPSLIGLLHYNNLLLRLGNFDNLYIVFLLVSAEVLKYIFFISKCKPLVRKNGVKDFLKSVIVLILIFVTIYVIAVLFGAPTFSHFEQTCMFSLLLTTVTAIPLCLYLGPDTVINMFLSLTSYDCDEIHKLFMIKIRLSLFGAWLGAIVIPLDWNRPWQDWPIPCCVGTLIGYAVANCFCAFLPFMCGKSTKKTGKYTL